MEPERSDLVHWGDPRESKGTNRGSVETGGTQYSHRKDHSEGEAKPRRRVRVGNKGHGGIKRDVSLNERVLGRRGYLELQVFSFTIKTEEMTTQGSGIFSWSG